MATWRQRSAGTRPAGPTSSSSSAPAARGAAEPPRAVPRVACRPLRRVAAPAHAGGARADRPPPLHDPAGGRRRAAGGGAAHSEPADRASRRLTREAGGRRAGTHRAPPRRLGGNALRAAVLGANDGLVSNLSLVMGVAGAAAPRPTRSSSPGSPGCSPARCRWRWANGSPSRARASSTPIRSTSSAWRSRRCPSSRPRSSR